MDKLELVDRAIRSAQRRLHVLQTCPSVPNGIILKYPGHYEDIIKEEQVVIEALKFYKDSLIFFGSQSK
jgi:hypothetical protein